jgi:hypothetical protein
MFVQPFSSPFPKNPYSVKTPTQEPPKRGNTYLNFAADRGGCGQYRIGCKNHQAATSVFHSTEGVLQIPQEHPTRMRI